MRVLMFGWEFPPHIAGGLGTACYGLTRGLARNGVEVIFVVPKAYGDEDQRFIRVVNASDVDAVYRSGEADGEFWRQVKFREGAQPQREGWRSSSRGRCVAREV